MKKTKIIECEPDSNGVYKPVGEKSSIDERQMVNPSRKKEKSISNKLDPYNLSLNCAPFGNLNLRVNIDGRLVPLVVGLSSLVILGGIFYDGFYRVRSKSSR